MPDSDKLPDGIRKSIDAYVQAANRTEPALWSRSERAWAVKLACDADKKAATSENRAPILLKDAIFHLGESKGIFYDDLNAWKIREIAGLSVNNLPVRSHWAVKLGRVLARQTKLALIEAKQPGDAKKAIKELEKMFGDAAKLHAAKPGAGDLKAFLKQFQPQPKISDPSVARFEIDDRSPMAGEDLANEIQRKYGDQSAKNGVVSPVIVSLPEISGQSMAAALANPELQSKLALAANGGRDVWILFTQGSGK